MIVVKLAGGLGNQMFQYAAGRALAEKHHTQLLLDTFFLMDRTPRKNFVYRSFNLDLFDLDYVFATEKQVLRFGKFERFARYYYPIKKLFSNRLLHYKREDSYKFDESFFSIKDNSYLEGYWQSEKYFKQIENIIRNEFSFKNKDILNNQALLEQFLIGTSVCMNVRRGDFVSNPNASMHHGSCSIDYFHDAVNYYRERFEDVHFFVFSDDIEWCQENFKEDFYTFIGHENAGEAFSNYLFLMTQCRHYIIPNSSFGWWAAWLNNRSDKLVIAPKKWYNNPKMDVSALVPSEWILI
jgi:hypothetical protein